MKSRSGRQKVLFGPSSPLIPSAKALEVLYASELDVETHTLFLGGNAERIVLE